MAGERSRCGITLSTRNGLLAVTGRTHLPKKKRPQEGSPPEAVRIRFARTIVPSPNERHSELRMKSLPSG